MDMVTHAIDCDMGEDCTCGVAAAEEEPIFIQVNSYVAVVPRWAYEQMLELGLEVPLAEIQGQPTHRESGLSEI